MPLTLLNLPGVDFIAARVTTGEVFSDGAFSDSTLGGPPIPNSLSFSLHFADPPTTDDAVLIDLAAFLKGTLVAGAHGVWKASHVIFTTGAFFFEDGDWDGDTSELGAPAPGAGLLGIVGLAALSFVRRKV